MTNENKRVCLVTQARVGSSRLPGKVLREILGLPLLGWFLRRTRRAVRIDQVVVATTTSTGDDRIEAFATSFDGGYAVVRGSEQDVLSRYHLAAETTGADIVVRVTSDCPLLDWELVDRCVERMIETGADAVRTKKGGFPLGLDVEVFARKTLDRAHCEAALPYEREHVGPFIFEHPDLFRTEWIDHEGPVWPPCRLTVDYPEDFELVETLYRQVGPLSPADDYRRFLLGNPQVAEINLFRQHA